MKPLDHQMLRRALLAIADAELVCRRDRSGRKTGVSATAQKAALVVLFAHEGDPLSNVAIADRTGIHPCNVTDVVGALVEQGLVSVIRESRDRRRYIVIEPALRSRATRTPKWRRPQYGPRRRGVRPGESR